MDGNSIYDTQATENTIVLIGNEGKGISEPLINLAENEVSIPRKGRAESLNAAVATAVILDRLGQKHP